MRRLAGVLLHMDPRDADPALAAVGELDVEVTAHADRQVVLADLVVLRHVRIEVVLPVEQRARSDLAVQRQPDLDGVLDGLLVRHGQGARVTEADRAHIGVGLGPELIEAAAEHLRGSGQLDVALQPDHGLELLGHLGGNDTGRTRCMTKCPRAHSAGLDTMGEWLVSAPSPLAFGPWKRPGAVARLRPL